MSRVELEARISVVIRSTAWVGIVAHSGFIPLFAVSNEPVLGEIGGLPRALTLTFGVASFAPKPSVGACVKAADDALHRGKAEGRNRVVVAA